MRRLLGIVVAALFALAPPAAFASLIPNPIPVVGLVSGEAQFTYTTVLSTEHETADFLTLSGGALGASTTLVTTGFLTGFTLMTGPNDITLSCSTGPCATDQNNGTTAEFTIASPATGTILGNFTSQTTETGTEDGPPSAYSAETYSGDVGVPAVVPEPASLAIFGAALAGLGLLRRRKDRVTLVRR